MTPGKPPPLFLVGFMGSGKTAVARALAAETGREFVDADEQVEHHAGRAIARIFAEEGEEGFRAREWEVLQGLGEPGRIVATGGGAFTFSRARRWMNQTGCTVWLDTAPEICRERVGKGTGRPLWDVSDPRAFRAFFERRRAVYALARVRVDGSGTVSEVISRLLARIPRVFR